MNFAEAQRLIAMGLVEHRWPNCCQDMRNWIQHVPAPTISYQSMIEPGLPEIQIPINFCPFCGTKEALMTQADLYAEYLICQRRGHQPANLVLPNGPDAEPTRVCKWCGSYYWTVTTKRESNVPAALAVPLPK